MYTYCLSLAMYIHVRYLGLSCLSANRTDLQTKLQCLCWETMILKSTRIFGYLFFRTNPGVLRCLEEAYVVELVEKVET